MQRYKFFFKKNPKCDKAGQFKEIQLYTCQPHTFFPHATQVPVGPVQIGVMTGEEKILKLPAHAILLTYNSPVKQNLFQYKLNPWERLDW